MIFDNFADRFNYLLEIKGVSAYKLSKDLSLQQSTLSNYKSGKITPKKATINLIASFFKVNPQWLEYGDGDMNVLSIDNDTVTNDVFELEFSENNNSNSFMKLENGQFLMTMPLAEFNIQAGLLDHYQDIEFMKGLNKHSIIVDQPVKGRYMAFRVKGDSMDDGTNNAIVPNSIVSTRELQRQHWTSSLRIKDFEYWVIYTTESKFPLLKQIVAHNVQEGIITCHSLNDGPEYKDFELSLNDVQALFYVVDVHRQLSKKISY